MNAGAINKLRQEIARHKLDALFINKAVNVSYLSEFGGAGQLIITPTKQILIVDFRYKEQAEKEARPFQVWLRPNFSLLEKDVSSIVKKLKLKRLGVEATSLSYGFYHKLRTAFDSGRLVPTTNMVERLRAIKTAKEIRFLKKAACLAVKTYAFAREIIRPGRKEVDMAAELQYFMRRHGADNSAFDIIVASGKRGSMPHALVSRKIIKDKEAVLLDLGCRISGYNSDLTRMVFLGKIRGKLKQIYEIVLKAQQQAIKAVRAGIKIGEIDRIARQYIAKEGLDVFFGHALGHGIGREVHEYPSISPENQEILKEGMVFTVEPAVYISGWGGIRIEDMVLVTNSGCEVLTKTT